MAQSWTLKTLAGEVSRVEREISALESRRLQCAREIGAIDDEIAALRGGRGPGRPRTFPRSLGGAVPGRRGGRRRGAGRPRKSGLTDFIRGAVATRALSVARLTAAAGKKGFKSANLPQVIRLMVGKASDLKRNADDTITKR